MVFSNGILGHFPEDIFVLAILFLPDNKGMGLAGAAVLEFFQTGKGIVHPAMGAHLHINLEIGGVLGEVIYCA